MDLSIVVDSSMDPPKDYKWQVPVHILPLRLYIDGQEYRDKYDINEEQVYQYILEGKKIVTSLPNMKETAELLLDLSKKYSKVIVLTLSQKLSGTFNMVKSVVENFDLKDKVDLYDSRSVSGKFFYVLTRLTKDLVNGRSISQKNIDEYNKDAKIFMFLNNLEYLKKGGRIGKLSAFIGKVFNMKPIISLNKDGELYKAKIVRNDKDLVQSMVSLAKKFTATMQDYVLYAGYGQENMKRYLDEIISILGKCDGLARVGPAVAVHAGPEIFGILVGKP